MDYELFLDKIYAEYKINNNIEKNNIVDFNSEGNTNIVDFKTNNYNSKHIEGVLIEQNHLVIIYYCFDENNDKYFMLSKSSITNIGGINHALICNYIFKNGILDNQQTIGRDFINRKDLYKKTDNDITINGNVLVGNIEDVTDSENINVGKKHTKRL